MKSGYFFLLFLLIGSNAWAVGTSATPDASASKASIVEIYCEAMAMPVLPVWETLESHLVNRERFSSDGTSGNAAEGCLANHAPEFEEAEFILRGREVLQQIIGASDDLAVNDAEGREARYTQLWQDFVSRLKARGMAPAAQQASQNAQ